MKIAKLLLTAVCWPLLLLLGTFQAMNAAQELPTAPTLLSVGPGADARFLNLRFLLTDTNGTELKSGSVVTLTLDALPGDPFTTTVETLTEPAYVALLLDTSDSMDEARQAMLDWATAVITNTHYVFPPEFFVMGFNDEVTPYMSGFMRQNVSPLTEAINKVNDVHTIHDATCIYDALDTAVKTLVNVSPQLPRRAIVLFTDGRDEKLADFVLKPCSQTSPETVIGAAQQLAIPIYIYLFECGNKAKIADMQELARKTSGRVVRIGDPANHNCLAYEPAEILQRNVVDYQAAAIGQPWERQRQAQFQIYTPAGNQTGQLALPSGTLLPVSFTAPRDYPPSPIITTIQVVNLESCFDQDTTIPYQVMMAPEFAVDHYTLRIETADGRHLAGPHTVDSNDSWIPFNPTISINLRPDHLRDPGNQYKLFLSPVLADGTVLSPVEQALCYKPPPPLQLDVVNLQEEADQLQLTVVITPADRYPDISALELYVSQNRGLLPMRARVFQRTLPINPTAPILPTQTFTIPFKPAYVTDYAILIQVVNTDGRRLLQPPFVRSNNKLLADLRPILGIAPRAPFRPDLTTYGLGLITLLSVMVATAVIYQRRYPEEPAVPAKPPWSLNTAVCLHVKDAKDPNKIGQKFTLDRRPFIIGRLADQCDLVINDWRVSRLHAEISYARGQYYLRDLGSEIGVRLDDPDHSLPFTEPGGDLQKDRRPLDVENGSDIFLRSGETTIAHLWVKRQEGSCDEPTRDTQ